MATDTIHPSARSGGLLASTLAVYGAGPAKQPLNTTPLTHEAILASMPEQKGLRAHAYVRPE